MGKLVWTPQRKGLSTRDEVIMIHVNYILTIIKHEHHKNKQNIDTITPDVKLERLMF